MSFCKYCGSAQDADAVFCTKCGKPISKQQTLPSNSPPISKQRELTGVDKEDQPYLPGDPITPEVQARVNALRERVAQYTVSLAVFKQLFRDHPDLFGEEEWKKAEAVLAEKYSLPDNSIFRQKDFPFIEKE